MEAQEIFGLDFDPSEFDEVAREGLGSEDEEVSVYSTAHTYVYMYHIYLNIGPGVYFLPASFDPALKRGWRLNGAGVYNKINVRYSRILLESTPNSLTAAFFDFFSAVSTTSLKRNAVRLVF